ncbi:T-cell surface glycoprotein CD3 epsilon chain isoform X1 [Equus asinus]|uniref:T-cell surface glycoprotein CD3 epsilon chain n=1 Tax=Equus asinus TaxID=9793 RepID=A0A8C4LAW3_EQUAS|nr:T-cell surface glycoprotein CD3 epsilon chain isoform X1 [Equus asinus]XP_044608955.1 T-cell surface glycoprotein CD3 epsilon chain isoform X1 [Equus asinus]XP_046541874.1 T-cell surface glycoprotein CD3 epsilon chain [Equus quagga]XP_046541875.1 T-cell surface glycoprotein CD3 epsilon chain [Equus quagga]
MQSGNLWRVLGLCLLSVGAWGQDETEETVPEKPASGQKRYEVSISGTTVKLTCPENFGNELVWEINDQKSKEKDQTLVLENFSEVENSGYYICYQESSEKTHYLYLKARVCENCMEVDLTAVATIIVVDLCITLGLLLLVYYWSKSKKARAKPVTRGADVGGRPRGQNKERPPPVPNPDYEPIRKGQRDLYAGLNQRAV